MASPTITTTPTRRPTAEMERIRHVPDWEIPLNYPPKKKESFWSRYIKPSDSKKPIIPLFTRRRTSISGGGGGGPPLTTKETNITLPPPSPSSPTTTSSRPRTFKTRFNTLFPPQKRYCFNHLSRKLFLSLLIFLILAMLALALGLGLGLGLHHGHSSLPLPWNKNGYSLQQNAEFTYFSPSVGLSACGQIHADNELICAVGYELFDGAAKDKKVGEGNPNANPLCGMRIKVKRDDGKEVEVQVVDRCTGCGVKDLDLSKGAFEEIADEKDGRIKGSWEWVQ
ncbi:hypothetical protein QBC38DRAFT_168918 [Podospora fimiseda]|uniref:RlpA-like protein double-psi beta-barrel domain-containing protein n=1 Tax=Podospora fimiseda TaxID=252190 RepID=A0AAN7BR16_9PEZI|nr:hypothetical protein QBC38DRAFT_168918 [Podospora fimiseda]